MSRRQRQFVLGSLIFVSLAGSTALVIYQRRPPVPNRVLKIGFEPNPPYQIRRADGQLEGFIVDMVREAARRAGIQLQWVETTAGPDKAVASGSVDLWPLITETEERRKTLYISAPYLRTDHALLVTGQAELPLASYTGKVAHANLVLHQKFIHEAMPRAQSIGYPDMNAAIVATCQGETSAVFVETRLAVNTLRNPPAPCSAVPLRIQFIPGLARRLGVGSTFEAAGAADRLRTEIGEMFRDGTFIVMMSRYNLFGPDGARATYDLLEAESRERWLKIGIAALLVVLGLLLWQTYAALAAHRRVEKAGRDNAELVTRHSLVNRATNDAIWDWDAATGKMVWNEAVQTLFRYSPDQVGRDWEWWKQTIHESDRGPVLDGLNQALAECRPGWADEYRFGCGDGSYARVFHRAGIVYDAAYRPARMIGVMTDVTGQRKLEEQLRQSQKMEAVGKLAAGVAHDFNNLLTVIIGYADLKAHSPAEAETASAEIKSAARRASSLTQQLLAFSRQQILQPRMLNLNDTVRDLAQMLRRLIGEDIEVRVLLEASLGAAKADPTQMEQVLLNLAVNARDAMPSGGTLTIETANVSLSDDYAQRHAGTLPGNYVLLAVSDTGVGMDATTRAQIFEPFFTTKDKNKGTGLGLSTVYGIVQQSGGSVEVYSEVGKGSTFKVYLPRVDQVTHVVVRETSPNLAANGSERILLVEDDVAVRDMTKKILEQQGYTVLAPDRPEEAESLYLNQQGRVHLVLTDAVMPGIGGREVAQRIRQHHPGVKVLLMSGYTKDSAGRHGVLDDRMAFLAKPFTPAELVSRVREILNSADADLRPGTQQRQEPQQRR